MLKDKQNHHEKKVTTDLNKILIISTITLRCNHHLHLIKEETNQGPNMNSNMPWTEQQIVTSLTSHQAKYCSLNLPTWP